MLSQPLSDEFARRRERCRTLISTGPEPLDVFVVSDLTNIRYLSGFTGSNAALLISAAGSDGDRICTDGRYTTQIAEQSGDLVAVIARACTEELVGAAVAAGASRIGFESDVLTVAEHAQLTGGAAQGRQLLGRTGLVAELREVKDDAEVELLRRACAIGDAALAEIISDGVIRAGATERDVARALENAMFRHGADEISFETIVAAGPNSAIPHHRPTSAVLADGDFVKIDFGAVASGYHSDMTRTYVLTRAADWQREIYDLVERAQAAGRAALAPGADLRGIDAAARSVIENAGYGEQYVHGLGHGVGLEIHEAPGIGKLATGTLPSGAAVTVEPGVYLPGRGGVRIEDTLIVTDGEPDLLTTTDKTFTVI